MLLFISFHLAVCLTTGPKPLPKQAVVGFKGCKIMLVFISFHLAVCLTTGPKPLPKRALVGFKGCKIISLPGAPNFILPMVPTYVRSALPAAESGASPISSVDGR
jgi:hypothetical protein